MKTIAKWCALSLAALGGCGSTPGNPSWPAGHCGYDGAQLTIDGKNACAPAPSGDLRRFGFAASVASTSARSYGDVVNDLARVAAQLKEGKTQAAGGAFKLEGSERMIVTTIAAAKGQAIGRLTLANQGGQPARVLVDGHGASLDVTIRPGQTIDAGDALSGARAIDVLADGEGAKQVTGSSTTVEQVADNRCNNCSVINRITGCDYCAGSDCKFESGQCIGSCVDNNTRSCLVVFDQPIDCKCQ